MRLISSRKIGALLEELGRLDVQAALFVNNEPLIDSNISYLSGFSGMLNGALVLSQDGMRLVTTTLDHERALGEACVDEVIKVGEGESVSKAVRHLLPGSKRIGTVKDRLSIGSRARLRIPESRLVDIKKTMDGMRAVKEAKEIDAIRKSAVISNKGVRFLQDFIKKGVRENEVAAELERMLRASGSERTPFDTIVTSGGRSSLVHPYPSSSSKKIGPGLGLVDFGAVCQGYVTDVTVPFLVGSGTSKEKRIIDTVLSTYNKVVQMLKDGADMKSIHGAYRKGIEKNGFQLKHSLGHGIGLDTHEGPVLGGQDGKLLENMTLTIEPGAYTKGVGGCRLENDLLVTRSGHSMLTKSRLIRI
jgi:Xaa-Pro aminopeptidase